MDKAGRDSSVGTANSYGFDGAGSESLGDGIYASAHIGPGAYTASCKIDTGLFSELKASEAWRWPPTSI